MPASLPSSRLPGLRLLAGCLVVIVVATFLASRVQNSGGDVQVTGLTLPAQNGQWIVADLFRPRSATVDKPAPLVVVVPGFQRAKETQANLSLELARRGMVVIAIDPYAQGGSSSSLSPRSATEEGYGAFAVVEYASTGVLNYVDRTRVGVTGHSAGGNAALQAAAYFGREAQRTGQPSRIHSAFISGYVLTLTDRILKPVRSNLGVSYARSDEGAFRNELKHGDLRRAPEALRFVQSGLGAKAAPLAEVEPGRWYGEASARSLRVLFNEPGLHAFQPYGREAMANQLDFFTRVFGLEGVLPGSDQVWAWKEVLSLLALAAAFTSLVPLARLLLAHVAYFQPLVHPLPPPQPRPRGAGRLVFWGLFAAGAIVASVSYIPLAEWSQRLFAEASGREQTWFFPQRMNNAVMLWAFANGIVGLLLFLGSYLCFGRQRGIRPEMWGAGIGVGELARTAVLAVTLWLAFFLLLAGVYYVFHVDYRVLFFGVRPFQPTILLLLPMYAPAFLVFFTANSLRVNGAMRLEGQPEWRGMLLAGVANSLGLLLILGLQYAAFAATGTVRWTDNWLYVNLLFALVPMMFLLPYLNRHFFRLTGRIYLGPLTTCLIFISILLSNTVCYVPF